MQIGFAGAKSDSIRRRSLLAPWRGSMACADATKRVNFTALMQILHASLVPQDFVLSFKIARIQ